MIAQKIQRIQHLLQAHHVDGLFVANGGHQIHDDVLYYLLLEHLEFGYLFVPARGKATLFTIPFERDELGTKHPSLRVLPITHPLEQLLKPILPKKGSVAFRTGAIPHRVGVMLKKTFNHCTWKEWEYDGILFGSKLKEEISAMKAAAKTTDRIFDDLITAWPNFHTELDAARYIMERTHAYGVESSFPPIVASGKNGAHPHHQPKKILLRRGFCVIDMGVRQHGYCSDMTRTIYIGSPTQKEKGVYRLLQTAQEETVRLVRPGVTTDTLDQYCRDRLGAIDRYFIHGLGHGVGTQVHEWPSVGRKHSIPLTKGMVITIEPGIYIPHTYGIRIEDDILVTDTGHDMLTRSPKDLLLVSSKKR
ncbi:MAG TPA: M24 family metallopeptidase [Candidatus Kapabacteria bacterium]|nr:M24 family metallopeptidase [Candidatus Kapabacteria bacterium]